MDTATTAWGGKRTCVAAARRGLPRSEGLLRRGRIVSENRWFWIRWAACWKPSSEADFQRRSARGISEREPVFVGVLTLAAICTTLPCRPVDQAFRSG